MDLEKVTEQSATNVKAGRYEIVLRKYREDFTRARKMIVQCRA